MDQKMRKKTIKDLQVKEYTESGGRVYFKALSGYIVSLDKSTYFEKLGRLREYFSDREPNEARRLILENLAMCAVPLEMKDYPKPQIEIYRYNLGGFTFKVSGYAEGDPVWDNPDKDIVLKRSLVDPRTGEVMEEESPWRTERNDWFWKIAKKVKKEIFGD